MSDYDPEGRTFDVRPECMHENALASVDALHKEDQKSDKRTMTEIEANNLNQYFGAVIVLVNGIFVLFLNMNFMVLHARRCAFAAEPLLSVHLQRCKQCLVNPRQMATKRTICTLSQG